VRKTNFHKMIADEPNRNLYAIREKSMSVDYLQQAIRRSNRRILIWSFIGIVVLVVAAAVSYRYLLGFVQGPREVSKSTLLSLKSPDALPSYYVTVKGDDADWTGLQRVSTSSRSGTETVTGSFMALFLDNRFLLVEVPGNVEKAATQYTGALISIPTGIPSQVVSRYEQRNTATGAALPFMLDTSDYRSGGYLGIAVGAIVLVLCLWGLSKVIRRSASPASHPIMASLRRFGEPANVAQQINQEMNAPHETLSGVHLTPHWLVHPAGGSLNATRFEDVAWVYGKVTQHRTNGVPTGKTYSTLIWDRHGKLMTVNGKEQAMQEVLQAIYRQAPWIMVGYKPEIEKAWKSNRQAVLAAVEQRRKEVNQQGQPQVA
jgi:hypothetical protein